jgi:VanZ family protein
VKRWVVSWGPAAVWAAFLFLLSSRPTLPVQMDNGLDKVAHFGAYLILGGLLTFGSERLHLSSWFAVLLGFSYGAIDEIHQSYVPGRYASVGDWIADALGTLAGVFLFLLFRRRRASRRHSRLGATAESMST